MLCVVCCVLCVVCCVLCVVCCVLCVVCCVLCVVCCWLLVVGCWLLVVGCWLLVVGCWLLVVLEMTLTHVSIHTRKIPADSQGLIGTGAQLRDNPEERENRGKSAKKTINRRIAINTAIRLHISKHVIDALDTNKSSKPCSTSSKNVTDALDTKK